MPMTCVGQRICGVVEAGAAENCGRAWTWAWRCGAAELRVRPEMTANSKSRTRELITPVSKLTGDPGLITPVSKLTGDPERRAKRLERMRTGWDVHFRELPLTRIPVKITTPSLHFKLLNIVPDAAPWVNLRRAFSSLENEFLFGVTPSGKMFCPARFRREI